MPVVRVHQRGAQVAWRPHCRREVGHRRQEADLAHRPLGRPRGSLVARAVGAFKQGQHVVLPLLRLGHVLPRLLVLLVRQRVLGQQDVGVRVRGRNHRRPVLRLE
eukprot:625232-Rhodomonas_salina.3